MNKRILAILTALCISFFLTSPVLAASLNASDYDIIAYLNGEGDESGLPLSAELGITIDSAQQTTWTLLNTAPADSFSGSDEGGGLGDPPRIDALFFNLEGFPPLDATALTMTIDSVNSDVKTGWVFGDFSGSSGGAGKFSLMQEEDSLGQEDSRLGRDLKLVFTLITDDFEWSMDTFLNAPGSVIGKEVTDWQVAASFQTVGFNGVDSGVAVGEYAPVPEPGTLLLLGAGLAGIAAARRRKKS